MGDMAVELVAALREANEACPCFSLKADYCSEGLEMNGCVHADESGDLEDLHDCHWPGHAAIRRAVELAERKAIERAADVGRDWLRRYGKDRPGYHDVLYDADGLHAAILGAKP